MSAAVQTCTARADGYVRREATATVRAQEEKGLPRFVVRDVEEYLRCGVLEHGVVHLACSRWMVVASRASAADGARAAWAAAWPTSPRTSSMTCCPRCRSAIFEASEAPLAPPPPPS